MEDTIKNIPDVSFIDGLTLEDLQNQMISDFTTKYREITGKDIELSLANPYRLILYAVTLQHYQMYMNIDNAAKMNLLKYSRGTFLDQVAALRGVQRDKGACAMTTLRFEVDDVMPSAITIPAGTKVSGNGIVFATTEVGEIKAGQESVDIPAQCTELGEKGNGYLPGEISRMVDTIPFVDTATNIKETAGGADEETDDHLADRVYHAPSAYSVAGPADAYAYYAKAANPLIEDVYVSSPAPTEVEVRLSMQGGRLPGEELIAGVTEYLSARDRRPLTDKVKVLAPDTVTYNIDLTYYIADAQKAVALEIQKKVQDAIESYILWQNSKIGKDINPSYLTHLIVEAGAMRVEINEPVHTVVEKTAIPQIGTKTVTYGGIEYD